MRILAFVAFYPPHRGGVENYAHQLYARLAVNHQVTVVTASITNAPGEEVHDGVRIVRIPTRSLLRGNFPISFNTLRHLQKIVGQVPDIIHTHTRFFPLSWQGMRYAQRVRRPHVHVEHGAASVEHASSIVRLCAKLYDAMFGFRVLQHASVVVAVSQASASFCASLGAKQVRVIPNFADDALFTSESAAYPGKRSVEAFTFAYVGRLIPKKGIVELVETFEKVAFQRPARLVIVGAGECEAFVVQHAQQHKSIVFAGEKTPKEVAALLVHTDVLVNFSYNEGMPTSVLEGIFSGCDIIATDVGGTAEIFGEENAAFCIPSGDVRALERALRSRMQDIEARASLRNTVLRRAKELYSLAATANAFEILHREICSIS